MSFNVDIYPSCYDFSEKAKDNFKNIITKYIDKYGEEINKGSVAVFGKQIIEVNSCNINVIGKLQDEIRTFLYNLENYIFNFNGKTYPATIIEKSGGKIQFLRKIKKGK
jgi:hypothetical protein